MKRVLSTLWFAAILVVLNGYLEASAQAAPGDLDLTFGGTGKVAVNFGGGVASPQAAIAQSDGKLILAGYQDILGSQGTAFLLTRFGTNNVLDPSFGVGGKVVTQLSANQNIIRALAIQLDGKILAAGYCSLKTDYPDFTVMRYTTNGMIDTTFGSNGVVVTDFGQSAIVTAMAIQVDGKIVLGGYITSNTGPNDGGIALARYQMNGVLDGTFGSGGKVTIPGGEYNTLYGLALQGDQKIVAAGGGDGGLFGVYRFTTNGAVDTTFGGTGHVFTGFGTGYKVAQANSVVIQSGGMGLGSVDKIVATGTLNDYTGNHSYQLIFRYNLDGSLDTTFGNGGYLSTLLGNGVVLSTTVKIQSVLLQPRSITVGGSYADGTGVYFGVNRYTLSGAPDVTFGPDGDGKSVLMVAAAGSGVGASAMAVQSGKFVIAGQNGAYGMGSQFLLTRFTSTGLVDTNFNGTGILVADVAEFYSQVRAVAVQPDGKIVAVGRNTYITNNGMPDRYAVARFNADGSLDASFGQKGKFTLTFGAPGQDDASAVAIQPNGKIILGGTASAGGFALARLNSNGTLDTTFGGGTGMTIAPSGNQITALQLQSDGKILAGGYDGQRFALARFTTNGVLDATFGSAGSITTTFPLPYAFAYGIGMQTDGKIYLAGCDIDASGTSYVSDFAAARYNTNGSLDLTYASLGHATANVGGNTVDIGYAMAVQPDGKILVAGTAGFGGLPGPVDDNIDVNAFLVVVRLNTNGTLDNTFGNGGSVVTQVGAYSDFATAIALQPDGKILVSGSSQNGSYKFFALRYLTNGDVDGSYGTGGSTIVDFGSGTNEIEYAMALDSAGRVVIAGDAGGSFAVARLQGDPLATALKISLSSTNKIVVSWPYPSTGWSLQESLVPNGGSWNVPAETIFNDGTNNYIVASPSGNRFYRLQQGQVP